ncbi:MAG: hypothetical protein VR65_22170 [Desulfobulbaceae bacterium BRH_c16a]|nr:MAG: hypothetical protein VR65_22170 [Desulfobulbaceae bacterium BRH_c16a]
MTAAIKAAALICAAPVFSMAAPSGSMHTGNEKDHLPLNGPIASSILKHPTSCKLMPPQILNLAFS